MKLKFLGYCSNSFSSENTVSFLLYSDNALSLFDCGTSITNNLHSIVTNFADINNVFISHSHFDHFLGLPYFIMGRYLDIIAKKKNEPDFEPCDLNIFLPDGLQILVDNLISICHSDVPKLNYKINYHIISDGAIFKCDNFSVHVFEVDHTVKTFGFSISCKNEKVLSYTSDTLYNEKIISKLKGSTYLIIEGMVPESEINFSTKSKHATFEQMHEVVELIKPKIAFITHLQPRYLSKKEAIERQLNNIAGVKLLFPNTEEDYVLLCLSHQISTLN